MQASGAAPATPKQLSIDDIPVQNSINDTASENLPASSNHNYFGSAVNTVNYDVEEQ